jgi:hypothetical protein
LSAVTNQTGTAAVPGETKAGCMRSPRKRTCC